MPEEITITNVRSRERTWYTCDEGFEFTCNPVPGSIIMEKTKNGFIAKYLTIDENPQNPRTEFEPMGTMICFHSRYNLGDKHSYESDFNRQGELEERITEDYGEIAVSLPLYLYDHSGLRMAVSSFHDYWDSGQVGLIFVTKEKVIEEYGDLSDESIEKARQYLIGEVRTYDEYLSGDVYCTVVEMYNENKESELSPEIVCGFYGYEYAKEALSGDY